MFTLLPFGESSLPLVATLLTVMIDSPASQEESSALQAEAEVTVATAPVSLGQSLSAKASVQVGGGDHDDSDAEGRARPPIPPRGPRFVALGPRRPRPG